MKKPNPFLVAIVSGVIGALACLGTLAAAEEKPNRVQECVYATVSAFPTLPAKTVVPECKNLSNGDRAIAYKMLDDFIESALMKSE
jgi:hypothetical protein